MDCLGQPVCSKGAKSICWGSLDRPEVSGFCISTAVNGLPATIGNGSMVAFRLRSEREVKRVYDLAIEHGASCEGQPGLRPHYGEGFFAAYIRDLDGNKLAFTHLSRVSEISGD